MEEHTSFSSFTQLVVLFIVANYFIFYKSSKSSEIHNIYWENNGNIGIHTSKTSLIISNTLLDSSKCGPGIGAYYIQKHNETESQTEAAPSNLNSTLISTNKKEATCPNLLKNGHWKNFIKCGKWARYHRLKNGTRMTYTNTSDVDWLLSNEWGTKKEYPCYDDRVPGCKHWPPYYFWREQSYNGTWSSDDSCEINHLTEAQLEQCFQGDKKTTVAIIGDSVGRQLFRAMKLYLHQISSPWLDIGQRPSKTESVSFVKNVTELHFYWNTDATSYKSFISKYHAYRPTDLLALAGLRLAIITPNIVWPIGRVSNKDMTVMMKNRNARINWINRLIISPFKEAVKLILNYQKHPDFRIYLLAQHNVFRTPESKQRQHDVFIPDINILLEQMVETLQKESNSAKLKIKYLSANLKLTRSPDDHALLVPDGTHMMWTQNKYGIQGPLPHGNLPLSPAHLGLLNIIFNTYCGERGVYLEPDSCC